MKRAMALRVVLGALVLGGMVSVGCKKSEDPVTVPTSSAAETAPPAPTPPPAASDTASAAASATAAPPPVATTTAKKGESIDACCNALKGVAKSGKTAAAKSKAAAAAAVCPGIAKLVKDGQTAHASGLSQIRS